MNKTNAYSWEVWMWIQFTNITLEETIDIGDDWHCHWHKEVDVVDMWLPLGHALANAFLEFDEKQWLKDCLVEFKQCTADFMLTIFLFYSNRLNSYSISRIISTQCILMSFLSESKFNKQMYFLDVEIFRQDGGLPVNQRLLIWIALYYCI